MMMSKRWYVLRSKPRKEHSLCKYARSQGHTIFYPTIPVHPVNPRAAKIHPYFPGYMFVLADLPGVGLSTFHWMPFSQGLVCVGGDPVPVPENIITALHRRVEEIWDAGGEAFHRLQKGDPVFIREGMFEGYRAIFDVRLPGSERVRVLLEMLNKRYVPMEVEIGLLERVERR